jgi:hypothetical protein
METKGKVSKVAVCKRCAGYVKACHVDYLDKASEKEFTQLTNEGFTVKLETIAATKKRIYSPYSDCRSNICVQATHKAPLALPQ